MREVNYPKKRVTMILDGMTVKLLSIWKSEVKGVLTEWAIKIKRKFGRISVQYYSIGISEIR